MKKLLSILLITALLAASILPVSAAPESSKKEEVIYGILDEYDKFNKFMLLIPLIREALPITVHTIRLRT